MDPIPEIGNTYNCFDDGKISYSRLYTVKVKQIVAFEDIDTKTLQKWENQIERSPWLYARKTDYFIISTGEDGGDNDDGIFTRTKDGGWFSLGDLFNSGTLDVTGRLTNILNNKYP